MFDAAVGAAEIEEPYVPLVLAATGQTASAKQQPDAKYWCARARAAAAADGAPSVAMGNFGAAMNSMHAVGARLS